VSWAQGDQDRRLQGIVRIGKVTAVDASAARARVNLGGETETDWLPWLAERAASVSVWAPVAVGEQVVVLAPGGETNQGVIVGSLFSGANAAPAAAEDQHVVQVGGAAITVAGDTITITAGGTTVSIGSGGVSVDADVTVAGGDVVADGISLKTHTHTHGDPAGTTSPPS